MTASTGGSAASRSHGRSPWRDAFEIAMNRPAGASESACELSRNAKGHVQFTVTVRAGTAAESAAEAQRIFNELCAVYPYPVTNGSTD
jgi:hypothetical protein